MDYNLYAAEVTHEQRLSARVKAADQYRLVRRIESKHSTSPTARIVAFAGTLLRLLRYDPGETRVGTQATTHR